MFKFIITFLVSVFVVSMTANAKTTHRTFTVTVESHVDGDTVRVRGPSYWPSFTRSMLVRINGVDTPEKGGRAECQREANFASVASKMVADNYPVGMVVKLKLTYKNGKYQNDKFWRLLGDIKGLNRKDEWLSEFLISRDLAYSYHGGTKRNIWC